MVKGANFQQFPVVKNSDEFTTRCCEKIAASIINFAIKYFDKVFVKILEGI